MIDDVNNTCTVEYLQMMMTMTVWCFTSLSTLFKPYRDNGRMTVKGSGCAMKRRSVVVNFATCGIRIRDLLILKNEILCQMGGGLN